MFGGPAATQNLTGMKGVVTKQSSLTFKARLIPKDRADSETQIDVSRRKEVRLQTSDVRCQKSEVRSQKSEARS